MGCRPPDEARGGRRPTGNAVLAGARVLAGACSRKPFFGGGPPRTFGGVSRNPRPLARAPAQGRTAPSPPRDTRTQRGRGGCGYGQARGAVGVAWETDRERTRRPPHPFPPNPALGLGMRGDRQRQRTEPPGCTGGDAATILGRPRRKPARACWCARGISPWKFIKQKFLLNPPVGFDQA